MKCICDTCKKCLQHPEGLLCSDRMVFVEPNSTCLDWENDEIFNPTKLVALAIVAIGIVILLAKFL